MAEKTTEIASRERQPVSRRDPAWTANPFGMLERFADEIDSVFDDFGFGRFGLDPRLKRSWFRPRPTPDTGIETWAPAVELSQHNHELVVRADLPGLKKDDVHVDVTDGDITISGERRQEHESERGGLYRSERSYGHFMRTIPLPEGAITDQAKAVFKDGVLEVRMPAPPEQVTRGRRLDIQEGPTVKK